MNFRSISHYLGCRLTMQWPKRSKLTNTSSTIELTSNLDFIPLRLELIVAPSYLFRGLSAPTERRCSTVISRRLYVRFVYVSAGIQNWWVFLGCSMCSRLLNVAGVSIDWWVFYGCSSLVLRIFDGQRRRRPTTHDVDNRRRRRPTT